MNKATFCILAITSFLLLSKYAHSAEDGADFSSGVTLLQPPDPDNGSFFSFQFEVSSKDFFRSINGENIIPFSGKFEVDHEYSAIFYSGYDIKFLLGKGSKSLSIIRQPKPSVFFMSASADKIKFKAVAALSSDYNLIKECVVALIQIDPEHDGSLPPRVLLSGLEWK